MLNTNFKQTILHLAITAAIFPGTNAFSEEISSLDTVEVTSTSAGRGSKVENMDVSTTVITRELMRSLKK